MSSETTVIVIIGSVITKQYKDLRWQLVQEGKRPKIERIPEELIPMKDGVLDLKQIARQHGVSTYELDLAMRDPGLYDSPITLIRTGLRDELGVDPDQVHTVLVGERESWGYVDGFGEFDPDLLPDIFPTALLFVV